MRYLLAVARTGSMSGAARQLEVNHATVLRRIRSLEERLGAPVFDRVGYNYVITPAGQAAFDAAEAMEEHFTVMERQVVGQVTELRGTVRVTAPEPMGKHYLLPALKDFRRRYPEILVELSLSMRPYDLSLREADVAFRVTDSPPEDVVGNRMARLANTLYGPAGKLPDPADVTEIVVQMGQGVNALEERLRGYFPDATVTLATDSPSAAADAIKQGFGVGLLACATADLDPELERMPGYPVEQGPPMWMLTHVDVRTNARLQGVPGLHAGVHDGPA